MKNIYYILFIVTMFNCALFAQEKFIVTGESINIRAEANKSSMVIGRVTIDDTVLVNSFSDDWAEIYTLNGKGFINKQFIRKIEYTPQSTENQSKTNNGDVWIGIFLWLVIIFIVIRYVRRKRKRALYNGTSKKSNPIKNNALHIPVIPVHVFR